MALSALQSSQDARLMALRQKHAKLSETVEREQRSPGSMDADLRFLKRQKLMLKEQIEGIRARA
ncbi:MAG: YdcH family protein [Alphaproteobacteria bacterium]